MASKQEKERLQRNTAFFDRAFPWTARIFVLLVFVAHPLMIMPDTYFSIVDTKRIFFVVAFCLACFALLALATAASSLVPEYIKWPGWKTLWRRIRPYEYALLAYWLVMLLSLLLCAEDKSSAFFGSNVNNEGLLMQTVYLLTAVLVGRLYKPSEKDLLAMCVTAAVVSVIGILQFYGVDFLGLNPPQLESLGYGTMGPGLIFISTMSNRNIISTYLCLAFCVAAGLFARGRERVHLVYLPLAWIMFYMLILGDTESGYVGLAAAFALLLPVLADSRESAARLFALLGSCLALLWPIDRSYAAFGWDFFFHSLLPYLLGLGAALLVLAAVLFFVKLPEIPPKTKAIGWYALLAVGLAAGVAALPAAAEKTQNLTLQQAASMLEGNIDDNFASDRVFIWRRTMDIIEDSPILGHGPDQFMPVFYERYGREAYDVNGVYYEKAHNEYLQFATDEGWLGLGCMLAFYALALYPAWKQRGQPLAAALLLAMAAFLAQAFFNFSTPLAHPVVWCLWGVMGSLAAHRVGSSPAPPLAPLA